MTTEKAIHFAMFLLLLVGLCGISAWSSYTYLREELILEIAGIALSWGGNPPNPLHRLQKAQLGLVELA